MVFIVTEKATRPAVNDKTRCFYCQAPIGTPHRKDCVLISKKVKISATIEYEIEVPAHWDKDQIEFYRNEGSWCASNMIGELKRLDRNLGCVCGRVKTELVEDDVSEPYLSEK